MLTVNLEVIGEMGMARISGDHSNTVEPLSYEEALKSPDHHHWKKAMNDEIHDLTKRNTWDIVYLPPGRKAIKGRWVYRVKIGHDNQITRFKARWVAKGFSQIPGIDYHVIFAPTAKPASAKLFFALIAIFDLECVQIDIKLAYLYRKFAQNLRLSGHDILAQRTFANDTPGLVLMRPDMHTEARRILGLRWVMSLLLDTSVQVSDLFPRGSALS